MIRRAVIIAVPLALVLATPAISQGLLAALFGLNDPSPAPPQYYDHRVLPAAPRAEIRAPRLQRRAERVAPAAKLARTPAGETGKPQLARTSAVETRTRSVKIEEPPRLITAKPMGQVENPLPKLLADSTLQRGDIVIFPEGPRVFTGRVDNKHKLDDFAPITTQGVGSSTRKLLAAMKVGPNDAWSEEVNPPQNRMAANDVGTTGSLRKRGRR